MNSPIQNRIGMIFIPVGDMQRAIDWYSQLLGLPPGQPSHEGKIYDLPIAGGPGVILDAHRPVRNSSQPLVFFWTDDIDASYHFLRELGAPIVGGVEDIGSVTTLTFEDPDHNLLMVCQTSRP